MSRRLPDLSVYLVLDPVLCGGLAGMVRTATAAVRGGAGVVQLRLKDATTAERVAAGRALKAALAGSPAALVINDDLAAALAAGADGLHVGQGDLDAATARAQKMESLANQIDGASDMKAINDLQARVAIEQVQLTNELIKLQSLNMIAQQQRETRAQQQHQAAFKTSFKY